MTFNPAGLTPGQLVRQYAANRKAELAWSDTLKKIQADDAAILAAPQLTALVVDGKPHSFTAVEGNETYQVTITPAVPPATGIAIDTIALPDIDSLTPPAPAPEAPPTAVPGAPLS